MNISLHNNKCHKNWTNGHPPYIYILSKKKILLKGIYVVTFQSLDFEQVKDDICFLSSQSVPGRNVHYSSVIENRPLQDD